MGVVVEQLDRSSFVLTSALTKCASLCRALVTTTALIAIQHRLNRVRRDPVLVDRRQARLQTNPDLNDLG